MSSVRYILLLCPIIIRTNGHFWCPIIIRTFLILIPIVRLREFLKKSEKVLKMGQARYC